MTQGFSLFLEKENNWFTSIDECMRLNGNAHFLKCIHFSNSLGKRSFRGSQTIRIRGIAINLESVGRFISGATLEGIYRDSTHQGEQSKLRTISTKSAGTQARC